MNLADRIREIIAEHGLKQKDFAISINVTAGFISKLLRGECGISRSTAALIEEKYGYNADWILEGTEPKLKRCVGTLSPLKKRLIDDIGSMDDDELAALAAFLQGLSQLRKQP